MEVNTVISNITFCWHPESNSVKTFPRTELTHSEWGSLEKSWLFFKPDHLFPVLRQLHRNGNPRVAPALRCQLCSEDFPEEERCAAASLFGEPNETSALSEISFSRACRVRIVFFIPLETRGCGFSVLINSEKNPGTSFQPPCYTTLRWLTAPHRRETCKYRLQYWAPGEAKMCWTDSRSFASK